MAFVVEKGGVLVSLDTFEGDTAKVAQRGDSLATDSFPSSLTSISTGGSRSDGSEAAQVLVEPPSSVQVVPGVSENAEAAQKQASSQTKCKKKLSKGFSALLAGWKSRQLSHAPPSAQEAAQQQVASSPVVDAAVSVEPVPPTFAVPQEEHVSAALATPQQQKHKVSLVQRINKAGSKMIDKVAAKMNNAVALCDSKIANFKPGSAKVQVRQLQTQMDVQSERIQQLEQRESALLAALAEKEAALTKQSAIIQEQQQQIVEHQQGFESVREAMSKVSAQQQALAASISTRGGLHSIAQAIMPLLDSAKGMMKVFQAPQKGSPEAQLRSLQHQVKKHETTIASKSDTIRVLSKQVKAHDETINSMDVTITQLREQLAAKDADNKQLEKWWKDAMEALHSCTSVYMSD